MSEKNDQQKKQREYDGGFVAFTVALAALTIIGLLIGGNPGHSLAEIAGFFTILNVVLMLRR